MMSYQKRSVLLAAGAAGLALTIPSFLPPLANSLVLGLSLGVIITGPLGRLVNSATTPPARPQTPEVRLKRIVRKRRAEVEAEFTRALDRFDSLVPRVEELPRAEVREEFSDRFRSSLDELNRHYPKWDAEGRLRTYVILDKIAKSMDMKNADAYLNMAFDMLVSRGDEATQMSNITLRDKVEDMYLDPQSEVAHRLAGTLMLMNREDEEYTKSLVADAIHLWTDRRFTRLLEDFSAVRMLGSERVSSILELLQKEESKAARAKNDVALRRAKMLEVTIQAASPAPAR